MEAGGSVQRILERLGGLECNGGAGGNFHRFASAWVAPGAGIALLELKCAEAVEGDRLARQQGAFDFG